MWRAVEDKADKVSMAKAERKGTEEIKGIKKKGV